jgi:hypothetical protein
MTLANRRDFLDSLFTRIAEETLPGLVALLIKRYEHTVKLLATCTTTLQRAEAEAVAAHIDAPAAVEAFKQHIVGKPADRDNLQELKVRSGT